MRLAFEPPRFLVSNTEEPMRNLGFFSSLLLLLAVPLLPSRAATKPPPRGTYVALKENDPNIDSEPCWKDTNVFGVLLRIEWSVVEANQGAYDWSYFDHGLALAKDHGKLVQMSITCGVGAPDWLYGLRVLKWTTTGKIRGAESQPAPWDPIFQKHLSTLISAWGARYDSNPLVASVTLWCGGRGIETFFAQSPEDAAQLDRAGGIRTWLATAEKIVDMYRVAWPTTTLYLACGKNYPDERASLTQLAEYALSKGNFGLQTNAWTAVFPFINRRTREAYWPHTKIEISSIRLNGAQELAPIGSPRMKGETVAQVMDNAIRFHLGWFQAYPTDFAKDPGETSYIRYNSAVAK
jgi:Beta-galactosidase